MSRDTLTWLRFIIPGIIFVALALPLIQPNLDLQKILEIKISWDSLVYGGIVLLIATLYYILLPRNLVMRKSMLKVNENIKDKLLLPFAKDKVIGKSLAQLREGNKILDIFYHFVDNDKSLTERAKSLYFNGLILSTVVDLRMMLLIAAFGYFGVYFFVPQTMYFWVAIFCTVVYLSTFLFLPLLTKRHISLSDAQLNYIILNYKTELKQRILKALKYKERDK